MILLYFNISLFILMICLLYLLTRLVIYPFCQSSLYAWLVFCLFELFQPVVMKVWVHLIKTLFLQFVLSQCDNQLVTPICLKCN